MTYFSRITLSPRRGDPQALANILCGDAYRDHCEIWQLFAKDPDARRDFLFRREQAEGALKFYVISERAPEPVNDIWQVETKPYAPRLHEGQQLAFSLRANPVVTRRDEQGKRHRHDVVMDTKRTMNYKHMAKDERPPMSKIVHEAAWNWLSARAEKHGFSVTKQSLCAEGYDVVHTYKRKREKPIKYATVDLTGLLRVTDPERLIEALYTGVGPAKGFGCGLLLLRRP